MFRNLPPCFLVLLCLAAAVPAQAPPKKSALDKAVLEAYVRHLYVMDSRIAVQVSDPKPSELPGFVEVTVHASMGPQSQDILFYVGKDGSKIVQGSVYDIDHNPFKHDLDKLKTDGAAGTGTAGAPVAIVEFSDFECPYCKEEAKLLREHLLTAYPKEVKMYFKEFPLESIHPWAKAAALAGRCVFQQSPPAFWTYHDWIFGSQEQTTAENFKDRLMDWAKGQPDLDALQLGRCLDTKATEPDIEKTLAQGHDLGINSTPTLFVNGRRITQAIDWNSLKSIIDYEIEYQKTAKDAGDDCGCDLKLNLPGQPESKTMPGALTKKQ
jgi:protein-disulfide isomerase